MAGMAFQNPTLLPWLSAIENVLVPLKIVPPYRSQFRTKRAEYEGRARALFKTVGLAGFETKHPWQLSGGMQQRASLCRALIHEPELLLLDEPFGALDAFTREDLWATLQQLWVLRRPTVILVTHDLREAAYLADRIFVMSARPGRIIAAHDGRLSAAPHARHDLFRGVRGAQPRAAKRDQRGARGGRWHDAQVAAAPSAALAGDPRHVPGLGSALPAVRA